MSESFADDMFNQQGNRVIILNLDQVDQDSVMAVAKAISSSQRMRILNHLTGRVANVSEIAHALEIPLSTTALHLSALEDAGLISSQVVSARRGQQRIYVRLYDVIILHLPREAQNSDESHITLEMPIGMFVGHDAKPTCGLASSEKLIGRLDDRASFYEPERSEAQLIWFSQGYLEYRFPNRRYQEAEPRSLLLSMEICSEVAPHHDDWPSDIFLEINGTRIGYWTSPGDFGGQRGLLTPAWWHEHNTQYGMLKTWRVDRTGSSIDGQPLSEVAIGDLRLNQQPYISVRIGVDAHAQHMGGLNIFGRKFGNHAQDIMLQLHY